jgi:hypothetical protein
MAFDINYLLTCHNTILCYIVDGGRLGHVAPAVLRQQDKYIPMLFVKDRSAPVGYLLPHSNKVEHAFFVDSGNRLVMAYQRLDAIQNAQQICLSIEGEKNTFCSAHRQGANEAVGNVFLDKGRPDRWEQFELLKINPCFSQNGDHFISEPEALEYFLWLTSSEVNPGRTHGLERCWVFTGKNQVTEEGGFLRIGLYKNVVNLFARRWFERARKLVAEYNIPYLGNPHVDLILATLKNDKKKIRIPACANSGFWERWIMDEELEGEAQVTSEAADAYNGRMRIIGKDYDFLSDPYFFRTSGNLLANCYLAQQSNRNERCGVGVLATFRNEGPWILEWVAHYRLLGFKQIIIYSNDNTDGSDDLLRKLAHNGVITWCNNVCSEMARPQFKAYLHAINFLEEVRCLEWLLIVDADEYLVLHGHPTVNQFVSSKSFAGADAISINWKYFGPSGHAVRTSGTIAQRFTLAAEHALVKTLFKPSKAVGSTCHVPIFSNDEIVFYTSAGDVHESFYRDGSKNVSTINPDYSIAQINHYFTKSHEEFLIKRDRGYGDQAKPRDISFYRAAEKMCDKEDLSALKYVEAIEEEMNKLIAGCDLHADLEMIERNYQDTVNLLKNKELTSL